MFCATERQAETPDGHGFRPSPTGSTISGFLLKAIRQLRLSLAMGVLDRYKKILIGAALFLLPHGIGLNVVGQQANLEDLNGVQC